MKDFTLIKRLWRDLKPFHRRVFLIAFLYFPVTFLNISQPLIIGQAMERVFNLGYSKEIFLWGLYLFIAISFLAIFELLQGFLLQVLGQNLIKTLRQKSFSKTLKLPMSYLDQTPMGKVLTHIVNDCESVAEIFSLGAIQIIGDLLFLFATMIMLFLVDLKLTLYSFLVLPFLFIGIYFFRIWTKHAFYKVRSLLSNMNSFLQENLSGMGFIQTLGLTSFISKDFENKNHQYLEANKRAILLDASIYSFVDSISFLAVGFALYGASFLTYEGILKVGVLVAFIEALSRFFVPIKEFSNRYVVLQGALVSLQRIYDFLDEKEEIIDQGININNFNSCIEFKNVWFFYRKYEWILKDVSFSINKGDSIAIIGETGSGKTSIIKLLNRFYNVTKGSITIDGENIDNISLKSYRNLFSVVPQEVFLFKGTIRENLCYGQNFSDEDIWHALHLAQMDDYIRKNGGLLMPVSFKGLNFSQGQRQLLAMARALIVKKPILILDEACSSVDTSTSLFLNRAIKNVIKERTSIIIAHKPSTVLNCNQIWVLKDGMILKNKEFFKDSFDGFASSLTLKNI